MITFKKTSTLLVSLIALALIICVGSVKAYSVPTSTEVQNYFNVSLTETGKTLDKATNDLLENAWAKHSLAIWLSLAKSFRERVQPFGTFDWYNENNVFDSERAIQTMRPTIALTGICFLLAFCCLLVFPCVCCCCYFRRKKLYTEGGTTTGTWIAFFSLLFCVGMLLAALVLSFLSVDVFTGGYVAIAASVLDIITAVEAKLSDVIVTIGAILKMIQPIVEQSLDLIRTLPYQTKADALSQELGTLSIALGGIVKSVSSVKSNGTAVLATVDNTKTTATSFKTQFLSILTDIDNLYKNRTIPGNPGASTSVRNNGDVNGNLQSSLNSVNTNFPVSSLNDSLSMFDSIPNITSIQVTIDNIRSNLTNLIDESIEKSISDIKGNLGGNLGSTVSSVNDTVSGMLQDIFGIVVDLKNSFIEFKPVSDTYMNYRKYANWAILVIISVIVLVTISGLLLRTPVTFKVTTEMSLLCGFLLWLLCGIFFALAISLSFFCKTILYENLNPIMPILPSTISFLPDVLDSIHKCADVEKTNLFEEMTKWGSLNLTVPDFKDKIDEFLGQVDYVSMINGINLEDSFSMPGNFDDINKKVNEYNSSTINISELKNITIVDKLAGYLADLRNGTVFLNSTINSFTINKYGNPTTNEVDTAVQYYYSQINLILGKISTLNNTVLPNLKTLVASISVQAENTKTAAGDAVNSVKTVIISKDAVNASAYEFVSYVKGYLINTTIPKVFDNIRAFAGNATGAYQYLGTCTRFGKGVKAFEIGICERLPVSLDAMWWSFGYLAFFITFGALFMGMGVTRFASHDTSIKSGARNFKDVIKSGKK